MTTTFTMDASTLASVAAWVSRVCPAKPPTPILGGILVDVDEGEIRLTAYDYETAASVTVPTMLATPGRMLVSGRLLAAVAAAAAKAGGKTPDVTVTDSGSVHTIRAGRSEWTLPALPVEDYPQIPGTDTPASEVAADELRRALGRVLPAVDRKGTLPALGGVQIAADGDQLTLAATDRFRLAAAVTPWKPHGANLPDMLVPHDLLESAVKSLAGAGTARIGATPGSFTIATDTHTLTGRTIAAAFPAWQKLMPDGPGETVAVVAAAALARAVDQASVMLEGVPSLRLAFTPDTVEVSLAGDDRSAKAYADVTHHRGEPMTVAVNPGFLRDALTAAESELVEIRFGVNPNRPILVLPVAADGALRDEYRHLLMPVRA
jgi:DNA polymerase-3 subunit beta